MTTRGCVQPLVEIGGYFGLDLPDYGDLYPDAIKFQSGRAAIRAVLECNEIAQVMIPEYTCDSVIKAATDAEVEVITYSVDESLYPKCLPDKLPDRCAVIYVNYFGLCQHNVSRLRKEIPADRLIIDNSQALFAPHEDVLATVYSPRKFVGLPDGGLLKASPMLRLAPPMEEDIGSFERMRYMLKRMAYSAREGYSDFHAARNSLRDTTPIAMSRLTQRLMKSIRWDQVIDRRRRNYVEMARQLDTANGFRWPLGENAVPLCYPFTLLGREISKIKSELASRDIFVPTYWPDALPRAVPGSTEAVFVNQTLFLPVDQRMGQPEVELVCSQVLQLAVG